MLIDESQTKLLKSFLCSRLEPICDAEPSVLSDYIIALLKHDKDLNELKDSCKAQLEDFLREETDKFVEMLFEYLSLQNYSFDKKKSGGEDSKKIAYDTDEEDNGSHRKNRRIESERVPPVKDVFEDDSIRRKRQKCRDFEQDGYCLKGDVCPFYHGEDRINVHSSVEVRKQFGRKTKEMKPRRKENNNTRLIVEKIPVEQCSIAKVHDFFSKFGTLVNINVDPTMQKAHLQFSSPQEAFKAHQCPEAIFNNRFVKIYWDKSSSPEQPLEPKPALVSSTPPPTEAPKIPHKIAVQKKKQENLKALLELQKKKYALLEDSIKQQKILLERLSSKTITEKEKKEIYETLKPIEESIKAITASLAEDKKKESKTEEEVLQMKLESLKAEASSLGLVDEKGNLKKPNLIKGRSLKIDNRATSISLASLPEKLRGNNEEMQKICSPFKQLSGIEFSSDGSEAILTFASRPFAEKAYQVISKTELGKQIQITWKEKESPSSIST